MKAKNLFIVIIILSIASCKKDTTPAVQPGVFSFDIAGTHYSFTLTQLQLQVVDTGAAKGKYLSLNNGSSAFPQVQFVITDRSNNYGASCFSTGPYPSLESNSVCHDSLPSDFCIGFFMQYVDTGVGRLGLYATNDSVSLLTIISCTGGGNGTPNTINGAFSCVLTDSTGFISPRQVTNGQLSNINYTRP